MVLESFLEDGSFELDLSEVESYSGEQGAFTAGETEQFTEASSSLGNTRALLKWRVAIGQW